MSNDKTANYVIKFLLCIVREIDNGYRSINCKFKVNASVQKNIVKYYWTLSLNVSKNLLAIRQVYFLPVASSAVISIITQMKALQFYAIYFIV